MTPPIKERLLLEANNLTSVQRFCSLIIDKAAISPKVIYDRKLDSFFGYKETIPEPRNEGERIDNPKMLVVANRVLS